MARTVQARLMRAAELTANGAKLPDGVTAMSAEPVSALITLVHVTDDQGNRRTFKVRVGEMSN